MRSRYTLIASLVITAVVGLLIASNSFASMTATCSTIGVTVSDADGIRCESASESSGLFAVLSQAQTRIIKIYVDANRFIDLAPMSADMTAALNTAVPRPIVTYLDANRLIPLAEPAGDFILALDQVSDRVYIRHADASRQIAVDNYPADVIIDNDPPQISQLEAETSGGGSSITIRWQTNEFATSRVIYGTAISNLNQEIVSDRYTQNHEIVIPQVTMNTTYYYRVSSQDRNNNEVFSGGIESIVVVPNAPTAAFTADTQAGIAPLSVTFTDQSTDPTSWNWNFGDGNSSTSQNPSHTYTNPGTYTVSLTASNAGGSDTETKTDYIVVVAPVPIAAFTVDTESGTAPLTVSFTDQSADATSWNWNFGDGNSSTSQSPSHIYTDPGTYTVSLTVSNTEGSDTETKTGYIVVAAAPPPVPTAAFTADTQSGIDPLTVRFTDQSVAATSWYWDFGDGNSSTGQNPTHTYTDPGTYTVSLTVSNSSGNHSEIKTDYIEVKVSYPIYLPFTTR